MYLGNHVITSSNSSVKTKLKPNTQNNQCILPFTFSSLNFETLPNVFKHEQKNKCKQLLKCRYFTCNNAPQHRIRIAQI